MPPPPPLLQVTPPLTLPKLVLPGPGLLPSLLPLLPLLPLLLLLKSK